MDTDQRFIQSLAIAVAARLHEVVPPGYSVWAEGVSVRYGMAGEHEVFAGRTNLDWMFEDQVLMSAVQAAVERTLDDAQEWVREESTEQWPAKVDGLPWATLEDNTIRMGFGSLELRPISMTELGDAAAPA